MIRQPNLLCRPSMIPTCQLGIQNLHIHGKYPSGSGIYSHIVRHFLAPSPSTVKRSTVDSTLFTVMSSPGHVNHVFTIMTLFHSDGEHHQGHCQQPWLSGIEGTMVLFAILRAPHDATYWWHGKTLLCPTKVSPSLLSQTLTKEVPDKVRIWRRSCCNDASCRTSAMYGLCPAHKGLFSSTRSCIPSWHTYTGGHSQSAGAHWNIDCWAGLCGSLHGEAITGEECHVGANTGRESHRGASTGR